MTDAGWAEKAVDKMIERLDCACETCVGPGCQKLLQAEHTRSVRIVKKLQKAIELDQHSYNFTAKTAYLAALSHVLTALQRGRGGKGCVSSI